MGLDQVVLAHWLSDPEARLLLEEHAAFLQLALRFSLFRFKARRLRTTGVFAEVPQGRRGLLRNPWPVGSEVDGGVEPQGLWVHRVLEFQVCLLTGDELHMRRARPARKQPTSLRLQLDGNNLVQRHPSRG